MGQGKMLIAVIAATVVLVGCLINVSEGLKVDPKVFHVGGKVLCQDCSYDWNRWLHGVPIKGARVSVMCLDDRSRVVHYGSDETDELGEFDIIVDKYINTKKNINAEEYINVKELNPKLCSVRLVSSPDPACNVLTDFDGGKSGVKLSRPSEVYRDLIKYTIEPLYFTSPMCDEPDTTEPEPETTEPYTTNEQSDDDKGNNY